MPFWERFVTSAGAGGLAALTAAIIAACIAGIQLRHAKRQQRHDRWWDTLSWVYDRAVVDAEKKESLPHRVTFTMLNELAEQARSKPTDSLQVGTIGAVLSMFSISEEVVKATSVGDNSTNAPGGKADPAHHQSTGQSSGLEVSDPAAINLLEQLRSSVASVTLSISGAARATGMQYELSLGEALSRLSLPFNKISNASIPFDFVIRGDGPRRLYIEALYSVRTDRMFGILGRAHAFLNSSSQTAQALIVLNAEIPAAWRKALEEFGDSRIRVVTWRDRDDDDMLRAAIRQQS